MGLTPNHQQKVNDCYPKKEGEGTVTGKLSSLIYYINARPQKLVKVATYLSVKVGKDVGRQKDSYSAACDNCKLTLVCLSRYNEVTLDIVMAIMKNCSSYFETFCPFALIVLLHMLQSPSHGLALRSLQTLSEFCVRSKNILGNIHDDQFFRNLNDLTLYFSRLCVRNQDANHAVDADMWQSLGFQGLNLVINMEDFRNDFGLKRIRTVVETIWTNMKGFSDFLPNAAGKSLPDTHNITESGQRCIITLSNLLGKSTATSLPMVINTLFETCEINGWEPKSLCMFFFSSVALHVPAQYLFVVISSIFKHLEMMKYHDAATVSLLFCVYQILSHNRSPLGFSAIELVKNVLEQTRIATARGSVSLPVILTSASVSSLPESVSMCCFCLLAVFQNNAFMTQRYDILTYVLRKNFRQVMEQLETRDLAKDAHISDRHSVTTETLGPTSFQFFQVVWIFMAGAFSEQPKMAKFSLSQSPAVFFDKILRLLPIDDRDTSANSLHVIYLMVNHGSTSLKEILRPELGFYQLDQSLAKISNCLENDSSALPHFVLSYRVLKRFMELSRGFWIRIVSLIRTLKADMRTADATKSTYCTFIECLLLRAFSDTYGKIDSTEYRDIMSEVVDSQVYVDLFEHGEMSALNQSFGESRFEFDIDPQLLVKVYRTVKHFSAEECAKILSDFVPLEMDTKGMTGSLTIRASQRVL